MRKQLAQTAAIEIGTPAVLWSLLVGELALGALLFASDKLPSILVRSLQLFLRF